MRRCKARHPFFPRLACVHAYRSEYTKVRETHNRENTDATTLDRPFFGEDKFHSHRPVLRGIDGDRALPDVAFLSKIDMGIRGGITTRNIGSLLRNGAFM